MRKVHLNTKTAFTLMELIVVVIIVSIMAAFVIPNYQITLEKAYAKNAIVNLRAIAAARRIYVIKNNVYWPPPGPDQDITAINTTLSLNITPQSIEYYCRNEGDPNYSCGAVFPDIATLSWEINTTGNAPTCTSATCPCAGGGGC